MTHAADQERAEFEKAWRERPIYMGGVHQKEVAYIWWTQAARRAPAAPVPQGWVDQLEQVLCDLQVGPYPSIALAVKRIEGLLAAAPQPPEAAPVQLPEPCGIFNYGKDDRKPTYHHGDTDKEWLNKVLDDGVTGGPHRSEYAYTEQQVIDLLKSVGVKL